MRLRSVLAVGGIMKHRAHKRSQGFSLVEMTVAMLVLIVGVLGGMVMVVLGMSRDNSNRVDTTATNVAQTVMEQIAGGPTNVNPVLTITDCVQTDPATSTLKINTAPGGAGLKTNGDVDFSANTAAALKATKYQMNYTVCGNNGLITVYDVRWNNQAVGTGGWGKLVTVSAREPMTAKPGGISYIPPATLRSIVSM
jgi:Tfp pilus assembly protein PilV